MLILVRVHFAINSMKEHILFAPSSTNTFYRSLHSTYSDLSLRSCPTPDKVGHRVDKPEQRRTNSRVSQGAKLRTHFLESTL